MRLPLAAAVLLAGLVATAAESRVWKPSPMALAHDYLILQHQRSSTEIVLVLWVAPPIFEDTAENALMRELTADYTMILVAHANVKKYGTVEFTDASEAVLETATGKRRHPIDPHDLPPLVAMLHDSLPGLMAQVVGPLGQNLQPLVFDGAGIDACAKGGVWLHYAGERYEFLTPVPGCD